MAPSRTAAALIALALLLLQPAPARADPGDGHADQVPDLIKAATVGAASITAGGSHSCAITSIGAVYCWGANAHGQLGDAGITDSDTAVAATGTGALTGIAVQVDAGTAHTCAIDTDGLAYCWGDNTAGQLGTGTGPDRNTPARVDALADRTLVEITTGADHSCAIDEDGTAWCWGDNSHGQLGAPGLGASSATPVQVSTQTGMTDPVVDIAAGGDTTCAATTTGDAFCWGQGDQGEVGDGTSTDRSEPAAVPTGATIRQVSTGFADSCALDALGAVLCWGAGMGGSPVAVDAGGTVFSQITAGGAHFCGLDRSQAAFCWGDNADGAVGDGSATDRPDPVDVALGAQSPDATLRDIEAGDRHSCALDDGGVAYCWGSDATGQLGDGTQIDSAVPVRVLGLPRSPAAVTGLTVTALDGGLRVSWQPAADFGTGTFDSYLATTSNFEANCTVTDPAGTGCDLSGLEAGHAYDVAVLTLTSDGSALSSFVTEAPSAATPSPTPTPTPVPTVPPHRPDVEPEPTLPITGPPSWRLILAGLLLTGLGAGLIRISGPRPRPRRGRPTRPA